MKRQGLHGFDSVWILRLEQLEEGKPRGTMKRWSADSPLYGVVPVFGVFAVRVEEDVLIYSSTEAEHVWCRMFT